MFFDPAKLARIENLLMQCPAGRAAVAYRRQHNIPVVFDNLRPGADFNQNFIRINNQYHDHTAALILVHEVNHAQYQIEGWVAQARNLPEAQYVSARLAEEARGTAWAIHAQRELEAAGVNFQQ